MYYNKRKMLISVLGTIIGATLIILDMTRIINNSSCSYMGGGLFAIGVMQIYRNLKYHSNVEYKEKIDIEFSDERNRYIAMKAWSWAGSLFAIGSLIISIVLYMMKQNTYAQILSYCISSLLALYWVMYMILQKKS